MTISDEQQNQRLKLYSENKTDAEIAQIVGTKEDAIWAWRRKYNLPSNMRRKKLERNKAIFKLYSEGLNDRQIAEVLGEKEPNIQYWRLKNCLQSNLKRSNAEIIKKVIELHAEGKSDNEIAEKLGLHRKNVCQIRQRKQLRCHTTRLKAIVGETEQKVKSLYEQGLSDNKIAEAVGTNRTNVNNWRRRNGLKSNFKPHRTSKGQLKVVPDRKIIVAWQTNGHIGQCAKALGISPVRFQTYMRKLGLRRWVYGRVCPVCSKAFVTAEANQTCGGKDCSKAYSDIKREAYYQMTLIRQKYYSLFYSDPIEAERLRDEMIAEEGIEFTDIVLGEYTNDKTRVARLGSEIKMVNRKHNREKDI